MPPLETLRQSKKKVFAHWFSPFPLTMDNKDPNVDYFTRGFLSLDGENNKHAGYGGFLRERPLPKQPYPADVNWKLAACEDDVRHAIAIGLDGFTCDMLDTSGRHMEWIRLLVQAAHNVDPGFKIMLMPDMTTLKGKLDTIAPAIKELAASDAVLRMPDGRVVVSPYCAQIQTPEWWKNWLDQMKADGTPVAFVPLFQAWRDNIAAYADISDGASDWGVRSVGSLESDDWKNAARDAHKLVKIWMAPVAPQDARPRSHVYWEAGNSAAFRAAWQDAIGTDGHDSADWVQLITWNDYSEGAEIAPSTGTQYSFYDLTAYYTTWFKTGKAPEIKRDVIYYFHRQHSITATATQQDRPFDLRVGNVASDEIEALVFATHPGSLEIEIAGNKTVHSVGAGVTSVRVPLQEGRPKFTLLRAGKPVAQVASAFPISNTIDFQNPMYFGGSSSRAPVPQVPMALYPKQ